MTKYILISDHQNRPFASEWLDADGWKNDLFSPLVENGTLADEDFSFPFSRKLWTGFLDTEGNEIYDGDKVSVSESVFKPVVAEVRWVQKDGCWALFHEDFVRTVTEYKRLTQKNILKHKMTVL